MSRARDLSKLGNPNVIVADTERVGFGTQVPENPANAASSLISAGIVTAAQFFGDGSNLEGVASAGLGTAVDDTKDSIGQNIYFTNAELSINENTTVNAPDTSNIAYTQYQQVTVESGSELIIADGDSFIPDVLGIGTALQASTAGAGNGLFGTIFVDNIENAAGRGGPNLPLGMTVSGVSTFSGNVSIGGTLTYQDVTNVDSVGVVTARNGIDINAGGLDITAGGATITAGNVEITSGRLALGTNNPARKVVINEPSAEAVVQITNGTSGVGADDGFQIIHFTNGATQLLNRENESLTLHTNNTERLRIGNSGQLGLSGANYGTSGQVLTSQGGSSAPQWATPSGGAWEVVSTQVLAGSTQFIDFNGWSNTYQKYQLVFNDVYYNHTAFNIYLRIYKDATSGNTGTLKTGSDYAAVCSQMQVTTNGIGAAWSGWTNYHKLANNETGELWHGTYDFYMQQPVSTPSGNNECTWQGSNLKERSVGVCDACMHAQQKDEYLTGIRLYFFDQGSAISPTGGRVSLYRMKYS